MKSRKAMGDSGVKCRQCHEEIQEDDFLSSSPWPLRKDPITTHFCSEDCQTEYSAMQRTKHEKRNTASSTTSIATDEAKLFGQALNYERRIGGDKNDKDTKK